MKLIIAAAIALGIFGSLLIATAPAQAASCANARVMIYGSGYFSIGLSVPNESSFSTKTYERLESGVPVQTVNTAAKSYTFLSSPPLTADTTFRVTSPGCVAEYNPPDNVSGVFYMNGPI